MLGIPVAARFTENGAFSYDVLERLKATSAASDALASIHKEYIEAMEQMPECLSASEFAEAPFDQIVQHLTAALAHKDAMQAHVEILSLQDALPAWTNDLRAVARMIDSEHAFHTAMHEFDTRLVALREFANFVGPEQAKAGIPSREEIEAATAHIVKRCTARIHPDHPSASEEDVSTILLKDDATLIANPDAIPPAIVIVISDAQDTEPGLLELAVQSGAPLAISCIAGDVGTTEALTDEIRATRPSERVTVVGIEAIEPTAEKLAAARRT